jgi:hypothetical protein
MSVVASYLAESPLHLVGAALSGYGVAIAIEGICARAGWGAAARAHSWDVIVFALSVTVLAGFVVALSLGLLPG